MSKLLPILVPLLLLACVPDEIDHHHDGRVDVKFDDALRLAVDTLRPFSRVGRELPLDIPDAEPLYCIEGGSCVTAADFRNAAFNIDQIIRAVGEE